MRFGSLREVVCLFVVLVTLGGVTQATNAQSISYLGVPLDVGSGLQSGSLRAQLSTGAHGGVTVHIESADTNLAFVATGAQVPGAQFVDVFVPNGSLNADFYIQTLEDTTGTVTITASAPGFTSAVDSIDVVTPAIKLFGVPGSVNVLAPDDIFQVQTGIANISNTLLIASQAARAGGPGLTATVSNSNAAVGELVTTGLTDQVVSVIILPGQNISPPQVYLGGVAFDGIGPGTTDVTASIPGFIATKLDTATVTVTPATISYNISPVTVGSGLETGQNRITLSGTMHGGVTVHIEPNDTSLVLLAPTSSSSGQPTLDVFIADGVNQANFYVHGLEDTTGATALTATSPGFADGIDSVFVVTPSFRIASLASSIDIFDPEDVFVVQTGLPKPDNSTIQPIQPLRPGGPGATVTVLSSDSLTGVLVTTAVTDDSVTVSIAPGQSSTPGSVGTGGVAFDGLNVGTTQITAAIPGFVPSIAGTLNVSVTTPGIAMLNIPTYGVGSGLVSSTARARLAATAHGGVVVSIVSSAPEILLVSSLANGTGVDSIGVAVPDGQTDALFFIQGVEDTTGTVTITASAPQFNDGEAMVDIVTPALLISSLGTTIDTIDPPDEFAIQTGVPYNFGLALLAQNVRPGSPGVVVSASVDDSLLAQVLTLGDTSDVVTLVIAAGEKITPSTVLAGGVAFDGLALGSATVTATAPGFTLASVSQKTVTITAPTIDPFGAINVGAGLQSDVTTATLSTSGHGGVFVHVESSDTLVALVSGGVLNAGAPFVDIFVADGFDNAQFYVHGLDDTTGTSTITVSAPQFVSRTGSATVVQPAVDILLLGSPLDVGDPADEFVARVGIPFAGNTSVSFPQKRRGGAPPLVVSLATTDTTAARLETNSMSGDSVTVEIAPGEDRTPTDVGSGGVSLLPVDEGQTIVFASVPGFIQTGAAQKTVNINNKTIIYLGLPDALGAGLETNVVTAQLGSSGHGGVTVHIEVDDTTKAIVSQNALVVGDSVADISVLNGQTDAAFYLQAKEGASGYVVVTTNAPTFFTEVDSVEIVPPAVAIAMLPDTLASTDPDTTFVVRIGAMLPDSSGILQTQLVRPGGTPAQVIVTSADTTVGKLVTSTTSGDSASVTIGVGVGQTPLTVGGGGIAFDPVGSGSVVVEGSVPDYVTTTKGSRTVVVTGPPVSAPRTVRANSIRLEQNVPNPFNPTTTIAFEIYEAADVELAVFDVTGARVTTLLHRHMQAGRSTIIWNGRNEHGNSVGSGVYFYRLRAGPRVLTRKMVLLK